MDTLGARHDFLAAHKEVKRVRKLRVCWVRGGVEGAKVAGKLVHGEEIGGVFLQYKSTEGLFLRRAIEVEVNY